MPTGATLGSVGNWEADSYWRTKITFCMSITPTVGLKTLKLKYNKLTSYQVYLQKLKEKFRKLLVS